MRKTPLPLIAQGIRLLNLQLRGLGNCTYGAHPPQASIEAGEPAVRSYLSKIISVNFFIMQSS